jgi:hypothetical protein
MVRGRMGLQTAPGDGDAWLFAVPYTLPTGRNAALIHAILKSATNRERESEVALSHFWSAPLHQSLQSSGRTADQRSCRAPGRNDFARSKRMRGCRNDRAVSGALAWALLPNGLGKSLGRCRVWRFNCRQGWGAEPR